MGLAFSTVVAFGVVTFDSLLIVMFAQATQPMPGATMAPVCPDVYIPILIPKAASPLITGLNSSWVIGGALLLAGVFFGPKLVAYFMEEEKKKRS